MLGEKIRRINIGIIFLIFVILGIIIVGASLDQYVAEPYQTKISYNTVSAAGPNNPPIEPSSPSPVNGSIGVGVTVNLSWTGGDPDTDPPNPDFVDYEV